MHADLARIAFVSRRYGELRGLQSVAFGSVLLFGLLLQSVSSHALLSAVDPLHALGFTNITMMWSFMAFESRYRATFGRSVSDRPLDLLSSVVTSPPLLLMAGMLGDLIWAGAGHRSGPSLAAVALALGTSLVVVRDFSWRPHYAAPLVTAVIAGFMTAGTAPGHAFYSWERDPQRSPVLLVAYALMAFGVIVSGILDHRLLTSMLGSGSQDSSTATADASVARRRLGGSILASLIAASALAVPAQYAAAILLLLFSLAFAATAVASLPGLRARASILHLHVPSSVVADDSPRFAVLTTPGAIAGLCVATAATVDAVRIGEPPVFLELAVGILAALAAVRSWPAGKRYLLGALAATVSLVVAPRLPPVHGFAVFVCLVSAALAVATLVDIRRSQPAALPHSSVES